MAWPWASAWVSVPAMASVVRPGSSAFFLPSVAL